jgi:hypothetical protein
MVIKGPKDADGKFTTRPYTPTSNKGLDEFYSLFILFSGLGSSSFSFIFRAKRIV